MAEQSGEQVVAKDPGPPKRLQVKLGLVPTAFSEPCECGAGMRFDDQQAIQRLSSGQTLSIECPQCKRPIELWVSRLLNSADDQKKVTKLFERSLGRVNGK